MCWFAVGKRVVYSGHFVGKWHRVVSPDALRDNPQGPEFRSSVINAVNSSILQRGCRISEDLADGGRPLNILHGAFDYSVFPHAPRPQFAFLLGVLSRAMAWEWAAKEIRGNIRLDEWQHAASLGRPADILARAFSAIGNCKFPLYINPQMADEWFHCWQLINEQRMVRNEWTMLGTDEGV